VTTGRRRALLIIAAHAVSLADKERGYQGI
jgi:hypothetical protein